MSSFSTMFVWALTLWMVISWWKFFSVFTIQVMRSLSRWVILGGWVTYVVEHMIYVVAAICEN